jgi:hypothetical protein
MKRRGARASREHRSQLHLRVEVRKSLNTRFATVELRMLTDPGTHSLFRPEGDC